ncbi:MAG TPA: MarC family protein [Lentisphaeria bacterium]|nr:MAG: chemotaxis protein CheR [Lentisphaerae bacterium GWF2_50_93]HCE44869.1 MarC family protein [Lentisphaeria bacterium]
MLQKYIRDALILWTTIDPIGTMALFVVVTARMTPQARRKTALKATLYSGAILLSAVVIGQVLLTAMEIHLISLQVAGGIILFIFGLKMIFGDMDEHKDCAKESGHDVAVFPLAVPTIATPGAIMAVILLTDNNVYSVPVQCGTALILVAMLIITYLLMLASGFVIKIIGHNGAAILVKVMGMILAALSIELVMKALKIAQWISSKAE